MLIAELGFAIPPWVDPDITLDELRSIRRYVSYPVTPNEAKVIMAGYGDEVMEYIESHYNDFELPQPPQGCTWGEVAAMYLSLATELWCQNVAHQIGESDET